MFEGRRQRGSEVVLQHLWRRWQVLEQQLLNLSVGGRTPQIPVQGATTRCCQVSGDHPEQIRLVQVMQKAVTDDQISLPKQSTSKHLLKGLTKERDLQLLLLRPLPGYSQHRYGTVNADDPSLGEEASQPKRDVSRAATQVHHQWIRRQRRCA